MAMSDIALPGAGALRWRRAVASNAGLLIVLVLLVLMLAVGAVVSDRFRSVGNIANVFGQSTGLALVSLGQTVAVLTGGIDLAVGSLISLIICLTAGLLDGNDTYLYPILAGMLVLGTVVGLINGLGVVLLRVHPLIITLGMGAILQGITLLYALGPVGSVPDGFDSIAYGTIGPVPTAAVVTVLLYLAVAFFLRSTRFGRYIYAVGDDANAAKLIGLPRTQVLLFVYALSGFFAAVTAIYLVARFGSGQPYAGANYTLASITPVVVGGTVLSGGRGGVMGTLFGTYLVSLLNNLLNFLDVDTYVQLMVQGLIIILAVSVYVENRKSVA
jgi:ribose transport system permease protein